MTPKKNRRLLLILLALGSGVLFFTFQNSWFPNPLAQSPASPGAGQGQHSPAPAVPHPALSADDRDLLDSFDRWLADYRQARKNGPVPDSLLRRGVDLAAKRKAVLISLMRTDPRQAITRMVPRTDYPYLPASVLSHLEKPVDAVVAYSVAIACGGTPRTERVVNWQGTNLPVHTYGHRLGIGSKNSLPAHGFLLNSEIAMDASPVRHADPAEPGVPPALQGSPLILDLGGNFRSAGSPREARELEESIQAAESTPDPNVPAPTASSGGSASSLPGPDPASPTNWTHGTKKMLYARVIFSDDPTNEEVENLEILKRRQAVSEEFLARTSHGRLNLQTTYLTNILRLPGPSTNYARLDNLLAASLSNAATVTDTNGFDLVTVVTKGHYTKTNSEKLFDFAGRAFVGKTGAQLIAGYTDSRTASHEYGHNLGLWHANYWYSDSPSPVGADSANGTNSLVRDTRDGEIVEYGHYFSVMSAQGSSTMTHPFRPSYAAAEKVHLGWLTNSEITNLSTPTSGPLRLFQLETGTTNRLRGIRIDAATTEPNSINGTSWTPLGRRYWLNYRPAFTNATAMGYLPYGVQVDWMGPVYGTDLTHLSDARGSDYALNESVILLDMTPQSRTSKVEYYDYQARSNTPSYWEIDNRDKVDAVLLVGRTYSDPAGIHITPVGLGNVDGERYIDVQVRLGNFPTNQSPTLTWSGLLGQATPQVAPGQSANLAVIASDPDGDELAYSWSLGTPEPALASLNQSSFTHVWNDPGEYEVRCVVSDLRGGTATNSVRVLVTTNPPRLPVFSSPLRIGGVDRDAPIANGLMTLAGGGKVLVGYTENHLPSVPGSATNQKSDFLLVGLSAQGAPVWSNIVGGTGWDGVYDLCPLPDGGFAVSGYIQGRVSFGTNTLGSTNSGDYRGFVAVYGADGNPRWAKIPAPASKDTWPYTVSAGPSNTVIVGGSFSNSVNFADFSTNPVTAHAREDAFAAVFGASDGQPVRLWTRTVDHPEDDDWLSWLRPGPENTTYVVEGQRSATAPDQYDYHVLRWSPDLSPLWESILTGPLSVWCVPQDVQGLGGDLLLAVRSEEPFWLEHGPVETSPSEFAPGTYLLRLHRETGSPVWSVPLPGLLANYIRDLFVTPAGDIIVGGNFYQSAVFGSTTLSSSGSTDLFVARLTSDGVWRDAWRLGSFDVEYLSGIAPGPDGQVTVTGTFWNQTSIGGTSYTSSGEDDLFVVTLSPPPADAPAITLTPPAGSLPTGEPFSLTSVVTGAQPLRLQWSRSGEDISGQTSPVLSFTPPSQATNLTFSLRAANYAGTAATNLTLSFKNRQTISFPPLPPSYLSGPAPALSATSSSALPVVYASSLTNIARILADTNGPTLDLRLPGHTLITASQPGSGEFLSGPMLTRSLWVLPDPVLPPYTDDFSSPRPNQYLLSDNGVPWTVRSGRLEFQRPAGETNHSAWTQSGIRLSMDKSWIIEVDVDLETMEGSQVGLRLQKPMSQDSETPMDSFGLSWLVCPSSGNTATAILVGRPTPTMDGLGNTLPLPSRSVRLRLAYRADLKTITPLCRTSGSANWLQLPPVQLYSNPANLPFLASTWDLSPDTVLVLSLVATPPTADNKL